MKGVDYQYHWQQLNYQVRDAHEVVVHFHIPSMLFILEPMETLHLENKTSVEDCHEDEDKYGKEDVDNGVN